MQCSAAIDGADPKILAGQIVGKQLPLHCLVLDDDDMGPLVHFLPTGKPATSRRFGKLCRGRAALSSVPLPRLPRIRA
jgi:hypothetical protein